MTIELDPDLRLYARLTLGRGWRRATTIALWIAGLGLLATGRYRVVPFFLNEGGATDPGFLQIALLLLMGLSLAVFSWPDTRSIRLFLAGHSTFLVLAAA